VIRSSRRHSTLQDIIYLFFGNTECNIFSNTFVFCSQYAVERNTLYKYLRRIKLLEGLTEIRVTATRFHLLLNSIKVFGRVSEFPGKHNAFVAFGR